MEDTQPKSFTFVLMPFEERFRDIYEVGIKPACKDAGAYCERVDERIFVENILERVYNQIAKADVIVAEMTGRNPNVFYEVGYAHALNKQVMLLTREADDIPFDLKHYPHIVYGNSITTLKEFLEARVRWCVENPKEALSTADVGLQFMVNGVSLVGRPHIEVEAYTPTTSHSKAYSRLNMKIGLHNPTNKVINSDSYQLALLLPFDSVEPSATVRSVTRQPGGSAVANLDSLVTMFLGSWESFPTTISVAYESGTVTETRECCLRLLTKVGAKDYPYLLTLDESGGT